MFDFDPRDYDSRDEERHANTPSRGGRCGFGDRDRDHDWSQPGTRTRDRDDDDARSLARGPGNERQGSDQDGRDRHDPRWADRARDGRNGFGRPGTRSHATCACRVDQSASWFATAIASTPSAGLNRERSRPLARFEWSPVVISATTPAARLIHAPATFGICAKRGWSRPRACLGTATMQSA
jgi:hypothetical protein